MTNNVKNTIFWNEAAKYGAILGAVLALSSIIEATLSLSGISSLYVLMTFEWLALAIIHYYLLHRFTSNRARLFSAEEGFSFINAYSYILVISAFAGLIVGIVQYLHINVIVGYGNYTTKVISSLTQLLQTNGGLPASVEPIYSQAIETMQNAPEPSILTTVWSGVFSGLLFGAIFGLIIAGVLSRAPQPFKSEEA